MEDAYELLEKTISEEYGIPKRYVVSSKNFGITLSERAKANWDSFVIIGGEKGSSKSTLALEMGMWQQMGPGWKDSAKESWEEYAKRFLEKNVIYACPAKILNERLKEKCFYLPRFSSIIIDELKEFHKRQFATSANIEIDKFMGTNRKINNPETGENVGNKTFIGCCDNIMSIDKGLRNAATHHIQVLTRGIAVSFFINKSIPYVSDPSYSETFSKMIDRKISEGKGEFNYSSLLSTREKIKLCMEHKTFAAVIVYPNIDLLQPEPDKEMEIGPIEQLYLELDAKSKAEIETEKKDTPDREKLKKLLLRYVKHLMNEGKTQKEALHETGDLVSLRTLTNWLREEKKQQKS